jgi:WD40 repeat protein
MAGESTPINIFTHNSNVDELKRIYAETHPGTPVRRQRLFTYDENAVPVTATTLANGTPLSQYGLVNDQTIHIVVEDRYTGERLFDIPKNNVINIRMCVFENELFVTSLDSFIQVYDTNNGTPLRRIGQDVLASAAHIYISTDGNEIYVTDRNNRDGRVISSTIKVFSRDGVFIRELQNIMGHEGMFVHNNELFIPDETSFFVISSIDGSFSRTIDIGFYVFSCFSPISQEIFVSNVDDGVVHVYDIHGNQLRIICNQPPQINAGNISISPEGNELFLCCDDAATANVVKVFNTNGQYLHLAMEAGDEISADNVVVNHNTVFVQSYRNRCISAFSR